jgi:hypothetical protein
MNGIGLIRNLTRHTRAAKIMLIRYLPQDVRSMILVVRNSKDLANPNHHRNTMKKIKLCPGETDPRIWVSQWIQPPTPREHNYRTAWKSHYSQCTTFQDVVSWRSDVPDSPRRLGGEWGRYQSTCQRFIDQGYIGGWCVQTFQRCRHCGHETKTQMADAFLYRTEEEKELCNLHKYVWRDGTLDDGWKWVDEFPDFLAVVTCY